MAKIYLTMSGDLYAEMRKKINEQEKEIQNLKKKINLFESLYQSEYTNNARLNSIIDKLL